MYEESQLHAVPYVGGEKLMYREVGGAHGEWKNSFTEVPQVSPLQYKVGFFLKEGCVYKKSAGAIFGA